MAKYKFEGYTITNCGYHQPDHCVWWEAVDENGEACFHGKTLREVEFMILEHEWEQKVRRKDEEIEKLKSMSVGNAVALREALKVIRGMVNEELEDLKGISDDVRADFISIRGWCDHALAEPPRNCDRFDDLNSAQRYYIEHGCPKGLGMIVDGEIRKAPWKNQFEKWLFDKENKAKGEADGSK